MHQRAGYSSVVGSSQMDARDTPSDEYVDILAKRMLYSRAHTCLCGTMMCAVTLEVAWTLLPHGGIGHLPHHPVFIFVEIYVTLGLLGELLLRAALQRKDFWNRRANAFDAFVVLISIVTAILFISGWESPGEMLFAEVIVIARIAFRLIRCWSLTKTFQRQAQAADRKLDVVLGDVAGSSMLGDDLADLLEDGRCRNLDESTQLCSPLSLPSSRQTA